MPSTWLFLGDAVLEQTRQQTQPQGGGGTLIVSYIRRLGSFFGFKILNFKILGIFRKTIIFWGMKIV